ncbi:U1 small nuclear ribonucleoprotein C-like [Catharus ustulatus]|uniref:U1 small nuclear ribonucleoprotein C-like n=1 Tax=Catharus ustulatus TaxID=91951 RepID=UPI0014096BB5|nr:U1 small nuclear ribonucleoprotein C-like [Catharus ustulatus]
MHEKCPANKCLSQSVCPLPSPDPRAAGWHGETRGAGQRGPRLPTPRPAGSASAEPGGSLPAPWGLPSPPIPAPPLPPPHGSPRDAILRTNFFPHAGAASAPRNLRASTAPAQVNWMEISRDLGWLKTMLSEYARDTIYIPRMTCIRTQEK